MCENGNEEIAYEMLWSGKAYGPDEIAAHARPRRSTPA